MGQGLPLRPGSLDAAISISALQWIIQPAGGNSGSSDRHQAQQPKLVLFFSSLARCLRPGGGAVAQFYARESAEAQVGSAS